MDAYISTVSILIEQKSVNVDVRKKQKQSDSAKLALFDETPPVADSGDRKEGHAMQTLTLLREEFVCFFILFYLLDNNLTQRKRLHKGGFTCLCAFAKGQCLAKRGFAGNVLRPIGVA